MATVTAPRYDFFVSYRHGDPDEPFARNILAQLEAISLKGAMDKRDFDPTGLYYLGAVAVPADKQSHGTTILASITKGRYAITPVEILPGQTTSLDLVIP